jgi:DnaJ-class molecular chaperone
MGNVNVTTGTATDNVTNPTCRCCNGLGVQQLFSGEKIVCSACNGSGSWTPSPTFIPTVWPWNPTSPPWTSEPFYIRPPNTWQYEVYC